MADNSKGHNLQGHPDPEIGSLKTRDELLQVMYWMNGEGLGTEFSLADLQKFLQGEQARLTDDLEVMVASGLVMRAPYNKFALTDQGKIEGGRRFADEFESMIKPGHFECDEPDCDCHNAETTGEVCKHLSSAYAN